MLISVFESAFRLDLDVLLATWELAQFLFSQLKLEIQSSSKLMFSFEFCNLLNIISRALRFMLRILILRVSVDLCRSSSDNAEPSGETVRRMDLNSAIILSTFAHEFLFLTSPGSRINPAFSKDLFRLLIIAEMPGAVSTRSCYSFERKNWWYNSFFTVSLLFQF